jgi:hypothetical protein
MMRQTFRLIILTILLTGMVACTSQPKISPYALVVKAQCDSLVSTDSYWPGFETNDIPLLMYLNGESWLIDHPSVPSGWESVGEEEVFRSSNYEPHFMESIPILYNEIPTAWIYEGGGARDSLNGHAATAICQSFRIFTTEHYPDWKSSDNDAFLYPNTDKTLLKWQMLESEGLQEALKALAKEKRDDVTRWMAHAAAARDSFNTLASELAYDYVRTLELENGIPFYMETRARGVEPFMMYRNSMYSKVHELRERVEINAAAKAFLLDEFLPEWKTTLARRANTSPDLNDLLKSAVNRNGGELNKLPPDLVIEYERRAGGSIRRFSTQQKSMLHKWNKETGYKIILDASAYPMNPTGFDLTHVLRMDDNRLFHDTWLKLRNNIGVIEVRNQRMLTWPAGDHPLFDGIERLEIVGISDPPVAHENGDTVNVKWRDGEMEFTGVQLVDHEGVMTITME